MSEQTTRGLVVVGASAGGVQALREIFDGLPADFPAAVVAVLPLASAARSYLPEILERSSQMRVVQATNGGELERGTIFVAPPDHHTVIRDGKLGLNTGPRENHHRPSIDALFRSAAGTHGARVVGVILTGNLDDGAVGLRCIQRAGGAAVVQDPADSDYPSMPQSALRLVSTEHVAPRAQLAQLLDGLVRAPVQASAGPVVPEFVTRVASGFMCPDCGGSLSEVREGDIIRYECRIEHRYSPLALQASSDEATEAALWAALRALRESAAVDRRMMELTARGNAMTTNAKFSSSAVDKEEQADRLEALLQDALGARHPKA